ncbi:MAG TPA: hypothetical protein VF944_08390 [Candidatus Bathyarchaeia archaeon]
MQRSKVYSGPIGADTRGERKEIPTSKIWSPEHQLAPAFSHALDYMPGGEK